MCGRTGSGRGARDPAVCRGPTRAVKSFQATGQNRGRENDFQHVDEHERVEAGGQRAIESDGSRAPGHPGEAAAEDDDEAGAHGEHRAQKAAIESAFGERAGQTTRRTDSS